jgi:3-methyladenine DNA glycosylase Tag
MDARKTVEIAGENRRLRAELACAVERRAMAASKARASAVRIVELERERASLASRVAELEDAQRRHTGAVHAAYFAAWNECTQQMAQAAFAARNANPEAVLNLMGEHE